MSCATPDKVTQVDPLPESQPLFQGSEVIVPIPNLPPDVIPLTLVRIPSGSFMMGSPENEWGREANEGPRHQVVISKWFYLGKYEVTQAQWQAIMGDNPSTEIDPNFPVNRVSWFDAQKFFDRIEALIQDGNFRFPTEAEWEYAARAGNTTPNFIGDDVDAEELMQYAWFRNNSEGMLNRVGQKKPNPWGLHDMMGNVWEWVQDWYGPYFGQPQVDPVGPEIGQEKVFRGGSWMARTEWMRAADRGKFSPDNRRNTGGVRVAWSRD
jgi:formylglycine-generating enzyme required for sulfatase activity